MSDVMVICYRLCGNEGAVCEPEEGPPVGWHYVPDTGWWCPSCATAEGIHDWLPWEDDPAGVVRVCADCGASDWKPEG
jgi:hypothetical protein